MENNPEIVEEIEEVSPAVEQTITEDNEPDEVQIEVDYSKNVKKRIDKLSKKLSEKDELIRQLQEQVNSKVVEHKVIPSDKPTLDQYDTVAEYTEALTDYKIAQLERKNAEVQKTSDYNAKVAEFKKTAPDFTEAVSEIGSVPEQVAEFVLESDIGPALIYHLANNIDELERISRLSKTRQVVALATIEAALQNKKKTKTVPPPISRPSGNQTPASTVAAPQSYAEWKKAREQSVRRK